MAFQPVDPRRLSEWLRTIAPLRWGLKVAVRLFAPTHYVGAVAAIFDDAGQVLVVQHVFRTDYPWGLPGGWISRGESPAEALARELREELQLDIEVKELIAAARIPTTRLASHPTHLGLAYYARLKGGQCVPSGEVLSARWADPSAFNEKLAPFQRQAMLAGQSAFARERRQQGE